MKQIQEALRQKGWSLYDQTQRPYLYKGRNYSDIPNFRQIGKRRRIEILDLNREIKKNLVDRGYEIMTPLNVVNTEVDTLFIGAGLQTVFKSVVEGKRVGKSVLSQPCIRTSSLKKVRDKDGYSSSFVNICTEQSDSTVDDHLGHLENWFSYLSKVGLYTGHLRLIHDGKWRGGDHMNGESLLVYYGDLQIGDAVFVNGVNPTNQRPFTVSDIGFGLERIAWSINKDDSYLENIGVPYEVMHRGKVAFDALRTISLMKVSGLTLGNNGAQYRYKELIKTYLAESGDINPHHTVHNNIDFWSEIYGNPAMAVSPSSVVEDIQRQFITEVSNRFKINNTKRKFSDVDEFFRFVRNQNPSKFLEMKNYLNRSNCRVVTC